MQFSKVDSKTTARNPQRRSHAERRSEGKALITDAVVKCLYRDGYGATTIDAILAESGVSRGRLLHLFPSKVDLMIAVSRHSWEVSRNYSIDVACQFASVIDEVRSIVDRAWFLMSNPPGIAVLEILAACRSDDELARRFVPEHRQIQHEARDELRMILERLGVAENIDLDALCRYIEGCIRGLVIDRTFDCASTSPPKALDFLKDHLVSILLAE